MAIRTVRLDDEAEAALREIREATGLPVLEVLSQTETVPQRLKPR